MGSTAADGATWQVSGKPPKPAKISESPGPAGTHGTMFGSFSKFDEVMAPIKQAVQDLQASNLQTEERLGSLMLVKREKRPVSFTF